MGGLAVTTPAPMASASPAAASSTGSVQLPVLDAGGVSLMLTVRPALGVTGSADIVVEASNPGLEDVVDFSLQAAVPKYASLRLEPASGSSLPALGLGGISQTLRVNNSLAGTKPLAMRLRVNYSRGGLPVAHQLEVSSFPPGL